MITDTSSLDTAFDVLTRRIADDARLRTEFQRTRARFSADVGVSPQSSGLPGSASDRRHLEWFLLELRPDEAFGRPIERLLRSDVGIDADTAHALLDSFASVFEVTAVEPGSGYALEDLVNFGLHPIVDAERSKTVTVGDIYVGRIFPREAGVHRASSAGAFFRDAKLLGAVKADLARTRGEQTGLLRLAQDEIEKMFFAVPAADSVAAARRVLVEAGLRDADIDRMFDALRRTKPPSATVPYEHHDVLGAELDRLAFETEVDLELARRALLAAWPALARGSAGAPRAERSESAEIAAALAEFQRGEANGEQLDKLLSDLEQRLRIESPDDVDALEPAPDFPGVVGAMIDEFSWETERLGAPLATDARAVLQGFGRFASHVGVFENLRSRDVLEFACRWLPEAGELKSGAEARAALDALQRFCAWADETQDTTLAAPTQSALTRLHESLARVTEANARIARVANEPTGDLYTCVEKLDAGSWHVQDLRGALHVARFDDVIAGDLRINDRVRGQLLADKTFRAFRCYPPASDEQPQST